MRWGNFQVALNMLRFNLESVMCWCNYYRLLRGILTWFKWIKWKGKLETQGSQSSGKNKPYCKKLNEGRRTKEYSLETERQVLVWVSSMLMLIERTGLRTQIKNLLLPLCSFFHSSAVPFFCHCPFLKMNSTLYCFSINAKYASKYRIWRWNQI